VFGHRLLNLTGRIDRGPSRIDRTSKDLKWRNFLPTEVDEFKPRSDLRLIIITGGAISGKSLAAQRLYGQLPEDWRIVPLDNHIPTGVKLQNYAGVDWKIGAVLDGAAAVGHWRTARKRVIVEGVANEPAVKLLAQALGTTPEAPDCVVIQLQRSRTTTGQRLDADPTRLAEYTEMGRDRVLDGFEGQVPPLIPGATQIQTDDLSPEEVLSKVKEALSAPSGPASADDSPRPGR